MHFWIHFYEAKPWLILGRVQFLKLSILIHKLYSTMLVFMSFWFDITSSYSKFFVVKILQNDTFLWDVILETPTLVKSTWTLKKWADLDLTSRSNMGSKWKSSYLFKSEISKREFLVLCTFLSKVRPSLRLLSKTIYSTRSANKDI